MAERSRLLHVHHNVPGVLATVNGLLGNAHVDIESQCYQPAVSWAI